MQPTTDFAVIGGGAAGLAAAVSAAACGDRVTVFERGSAIGRKISASGSGRCNLMNNGLHRYFGDADFSGKVLECCPKDRLIRYWKALGIYLAEEADGRMYPSTFRSGTVTDAYKIRLKSCGAEILLQTDIMEVVKDNHTFILKTNNGEYFSRRLLIACGGAASPKLGGCCGGYDLLKAFGHKIHQIRPALCPLKTDAKSISGLSGIRVKCIAALKNSKGDLIRKEQGEALFTETGISGICIMQLTRFATEGDRIELDLLGRVFPDTEELYSVLLQRQQQTAVFPPETLLNTLLAPRLSYAVMKQAGIGMKNRKAGDLSREEIRAVAEKCRSYALIVTGNGGMEEAQVTAGGAECNEFDPGTMQSLIVPGRYAAGEVLNVDGDCGGFNLMFATAGGILAGLNGREGADL